MSNAASPITENTARQALASVLEPDLGKDLASLGLVKDLVVRDGRVALTLVETSPSSPVTAPLTAAIRAALTAAGASAVDVATRLEVPRVAGAPKLPQPGPGPVTQIERLPGVRAVIAVAAGKGGVGKSTVATNLAIALSKLGAKVGILDADMYGPSVPIMLGVRGAGLMANAEGKAIPVERYGISVMSMGFGLRDDEPLMWRGPMLGKGLQQFIEEVDWGDKDYVVIDMPPGTGDVQLSLAQLLPVAGAVVVTTPQDVAFADVRRAIAMFGATRTEVLGVIENMSGFVCGSCGTPHAIFGESRVDHHAQAARLEVLGKIPLDSVTAVAADHGEPITVAAPDSSAAKLYREIARHVARKVAIAGLRGAAQAEKLSGFFGAPPRPA